MEAHAAAMGHTQSLHTNALDEAIALPTDFSARIARNTQLYLQEETGITNVIDPWGGSYYVEALTDQLDETGMGSILKKLKILAGWQKPLKPVCQKCGLKKRQHDRQAQIDSKKETIIGVNLYRLEKEEPIEILDIDNTAVR